MLPPMQTLFNQLDAAARAKGFDLLKVYLACGLPDSTYYRHRNGDFIPSGRTFMRIMTFIEGASPNDPHLGVVAAE